MSDSERMQLEMDIISAIMYEPSGFHKVSLRPEHFSNEFHRKIIEAMGECIEQGYEITPANVYTVGRFSSQEISSLTEIGAKPGNLRLLSLRLAEEAMKELILSLKLKLNSENDVFDMLDEIRKTESEAMAIIESHKTKDKTTLLQEYLEYIQTNARDGVKCIPTPFPTLTRMLSGGFTFGDISFIGGYPGSGKTSFMLSLALHAARNGIKTAFIEAEMMMNEILERLNGIYTGANIDEIRTGEMYDTLSRQFISELHNLPLEIVPCYERTIEELRRKILKAVNDGVKFVFIDYLQVFVPKGRAEDEYSKIKMLSEMLRQVALQHNVHLCVASSLNRNEIGERNLSLASLYGSSQLGHDCAVAILLKGEQGDIQELITRERTLTLHVVKNRQGARGEINFRYYLSSQRMQELTATQPAAVGFSGNGEDKVHEPF